MLKYLLLLMLLLMCCCSGIKFLRQPRHLRLTSSIKSSFGQADNLNIPKDCVYCKALSYRGGFSQASSFHSYISVLLGGMVDPTIAGGLLSGGLHAITGPDHLAAILPASFGQAGWFGLRVGAVWGLGHGISAISLGLAVFFLKDSISSQFQFMNTYAAVAETAIGISLLVIGLLGVKECVSNAADHLHDGHHRHHHQHNQEPENPAVATSKALRVAYRKSVFLNGLIHGCSWDGAPSIAPAMTMSSWKSAAFFLFSYCLGTMVAMSFAAAILGEVSRRLGTAAEDPDLPRKLSLASSVLATCIGAYWLGRVVVKHGIWGR